VRRERDQQVGFFAARRSFLSGGNQFVAQRAVDLGEKSEERGVDAQQARALVQVVEMNAEAELHAVRIIGEFTAESRMQIRNSIFLVTGGASGLGAATARMAAEAGEKLAREIGGRFVKTDVSSEAEGKAAVAAAVKEFGGLHVLVNCAGIGHAERTIGKEAPHDLGRFVRVLTVNVVGTFNMIRLAADAMAKAVPNAAGERGVIVNTASVARRRTRRPRAASSA
jgi:hypothetical protein